MKNNKKEENLINNTVQAQIADDNAKIKKAKKVIIPVVIVLLIIAIAGGIFAVKANQTSVGNTVLYALMPKSMVSDINGTKRTIYVRKNPDYDVKKQEKEPMESVEFYYYDNDKEVVIGGSESLVIDGQNYGQPFLGFALKANEKLTQIKSVVKIIAIIMVVIVVALLIVLWFFNWCKREDAKKEKLYAN